MAQTIQNSAIEQQRVIIENKYDEKLVGVLHETGSTQVIILCHGFTQTKESSLILNVADALTTQGISVFRFDFSGNGESEGTFGLGNFNKEADDVHSVVQYFSDMKRVIGGILGYSKGGDSVLVYASKYHDVPIIINVSGRYNMKEGVEKLLGKDFMERIEKKGFIDVKGNSRYRVTKESLLELLATDMHALCLKIARDCRVLTVHGSKDELIPVADAFEFGKVIRNYKLHIIESADHGYNNHRSELVEVVVNFIKVQ